MKRYLLKLFAGLGMIVTLALIVTLLCKCTAWEWDEVYSIIGMVLSSFFFFRTGEAWIDEISKPTTIKNELHRTEQAAAQSDVARKEEDE